MPLRRVARDRWRYGLAGGLALVAVTVTVAMAPRTGATFFSLALVAVAVSVWAAGLGPALLATAVTAVGTALLPLREGGAARISDRAELVRWLMFVLAALVISALGEFMRRARGRAEASERRLAVLSEVHRTLEAAVDVRARLEALGTAIVPGVADACLTRVVGAEGDAIRLTAVAGAAGGCESTVDDAATVTAPAWPTAPRLVTDPAGLARLLDGLGLAAAVDGLPQPRAAAAVPLSARGGVLGVMVLVAAGDRAALDAEDLRFAEEVGRRAAVQLDNARLLEAERAAALALRRSDSLKTAMIRAVSHELRTPLTAVTAAAEALASVTDEADREELRALVLGEARRLERVVGNLLDLSRLEGGLLRPRLDDCSVPELVAGSRAAARFALDRHDVVLASGDGCPLVRADPVLTERILVNLLQNAATHGRPPVEVAACRRGRWVELTIRDHGPGVAPALDGAVFEPFVRGPDGRGLGLGLALSRRLARAQGGDLRLVEGGAGARFTLWLPVARVGEPA